MNGLAFIPYSLVQAANRPDLTAKFHLAEVPLYFTALLILLPRFGVSGVAAAWTLRVSVDAAALFYASVTILPSTKRVIGQIACFTISAAVVIALGDALGALDLRIMCALAVFLVYMVIGWFRVLNLADRAMIVRRLTGLAAQAYALKPAA